MLLPYWRYRHKLAELGEGFHWPKGGDMRIGANSRIGRFAYVGPGFRCQGPIVMGDLSMLAAEIRIVGADHLFDLPGTPTRLGFPQTPRATTIFGLDSWVGARVTIMEGLTIGAGAVVGSGSLVTRDVEPYTVVAGVPARVIRQRLPEDQLSAHLATISADVPVTGSKK
jgi:acetyltransferase-like isoleucine patch superfamily enzyme